MSLIYLFTFLNFLFRFLSCLNSCRFICLLLLWNTIRQSLFFYLFFFFLFYRWNIRCFNDWSCHWNIFYCGCEASIEVSIIFNQSFLIGFFSIWSTILTEWTKMALTFFFVLGFPLLFFTFFMYGWHHHFCNFLLLSFRRALRNDCLCHFW